MSGGFPIRCFTCGKVINHLYDEYVNLTESGLEPGMILDDMKIKRECCRRMFTTHVDIERFQLEYPSYEDGIQILDKDDDGSNDLVTPIDDYEDGEMDTEEDQEEYEEEDQDEYEEEDQDGIDDDLIEQIKENIETYLKRTGLPSTLTVLSILDKPSVKKQYNRSIKEGSFDIKRYTIENYIDDEQLQIINDIWEAGLYPIELAIKNRVFWLATPQEGIVSNRTTQMYDIVLIDDYENIPSAEDFS